MALNPRTLTALGYLAKQYGPTVINQLQTVLADRQAGEPPAAGGAGTSASGTAAGPRPAAGLGSGLGALVGSVQDAARRRSPEGRLNAKFDVLTELIRGAEPGTPMHERAQKWRPRLQALADKRNLVVRAYTGRERAKQLQAISVQIDELLADFMAAADEAAGA